MGRVKELYYMNSERYSDNMSCFYKDIIEYDDGYTFEEEDDDKDRLS